MDISVTYYFLLRNDGYPVDVRFNPVETLNKANRFSSYKDAYYFLNDGHYRANDPENYTIEIMTTSYKRGEIEDV